MVALGEIMVGELGLTAGASGKSASARVPRLYAREAIVALPLKSNSRDFLSLPGLY